MSRAKTAWYVQHEDINLVCVTLGEKTPQHGGDSWYSDYGWYTPSHRDYPEKVPISILENITYHNSPLKLTRILVGGREFYV